ncbi:hypothetical protein Peur_028030 [Populus x canadensis]
MTPSKIRTWVYSNRPSQQDGWAARIYEPLFGPHEDGIKLLTAAKSYSGPPSRLSSTRVVFCEPTSRSCLVSLNEEVEFIENKAAGLGFVGAPFTLASYVVEGGSSKHFTKVKRLAFSQPKIPHELLQTSMAKYIQYQADSGAQTVQIFASWATELSPVDFEEFSLPFLKQIVDTVNQSHPNLPLILHAR